MFKTLSEKEKADFLYQKENRKYKHTGHTWTPLKGVGKQVCKGCGLIALRNPLTDWCVEKGCYYEAHPQFKSKVKSLTRRGLA